MRVAIKRVRGSAVDAPSVRTAGRPPILKDSTPATTTRTLAAIAFRNRVAIRQLAGHLEEYEQ